MACIYSIDGRLGSLKNKHVKNSRFKKIYKDVKIGEPLAIELLTFFPGTDIKDWHNKAEIMLSSQIRIGPNVNPAPRRVNMLVFDYDFKQKPYPSPIQDYGGHIYGDSMFYYTKAYTGEKIGMTLRGVELNRINEEGWQQAEKVFTSIGALSMFTSAVPFIAAAGIVARALKGLIKVLNKDDKLSLNVKDLYFEEPDRPKLQAGRYVFWNDKKISREKLMKEYKLTTYGRDKSGRGNVLVRKDDTKREFTLSPYFVIKINARKKTRYDDFEIGAGSAEILEKFTTKDVEKGPSIFKFVSIMGKAANDFKQLDKISKLTKELKKTTVAKEKKKIKDKAKAHLKLLSDNSSALLSETLSRAIK
jgi:hypothetical protein